MNFLTLVKVNSILQSLLILLTFACAGPLLAQPVTIKFVVQSELKTELTSVTDIHVITTHGPYNYNEIKNMTFWTTPPDSGTMDVLRTNGIGVYIKTKYLKPHTVKSEGAWESKVRGITRSDSIWKSKRTYYHGPVKLSTSHLLSVLESNPESKKEAIMARNNSNGLQIVSFVSGFMIGYPIGQAIAGKQDPVWGLAGGGAALLLIAGIPLANGYNKHLENAISIYNNKVISTGSAGVSIKFIPTLGGGSLLVKF